MASLAGFGAIFSTGCQTADEATARAWGKPVVVLASVSEASGGSRDLFPRTPFSIPEYPDYLLHAGFEGFVDVRLHLKEDGSVKDASVLKSSQKGFEAPVLASVKAWTFPQLKAEPTSAAAAAGSGLELVCRVRFSIEEYYHSKAGADSLRTGKSNGDISPVEKRSHEVKGP